MNGIDVSNHNGKIDWSAVKGTGIEAVYIKATEGTTYIDPFMVENYKGADSAGMHTGFYHFLTGLSAPETQAQNFYDNIKDKTSDLRACLDIEVSGFDINAYAERFIAKFQSLTTIPLVIYASAYYARDVFNVNIKANYPLWVAHYGVNPWGSTINTGFNSAIGHQYTDKGSIPGILDYCDLNVFNDNILITNKPSPYVHNAKITELQIVCNQINNAGLVADGYWGPLTDAAVRNLPLAGLPYSTPKLTAWIQLRLGLTPDGIFGRNTYNSVAWWQRNHNLAVDGLAGYNTIKSLAYA